MMEVYAASLAFVDYNIGRVIKAVEDTGELDNTLIFYISGDNGASGEGTLQGLSNEVGVAANGVVETLPYLLSIMDDLGGPLTYNHYPVGGGACDGHAVPVDQADSFTFWRHAQWLGRFLAQASEADQPSARAVQLRHRHRTHYLGGHRH
jgi:arylsulfatase A-like enzyme